MFHINHRCSIIELLGSEAALQSCGGFVSLIVAVMVLVWIRDLCLTSIIMLQRGLTRCTLQGEAQEVGVQGQTTDKTSLVEGLRDGCSCCEACIFSM